MPVSVIVLAVVLLAISLRRGSTPRIDPRRHPRGLAVLEQVPLGNTRQWVLIRSEDVANPVVLFLHGGPGTSQLTLMRTVLAPLERHFTTVNWDQRGAGKSFAAGRDVAGMTLQRFVDDVIELATYLGRRFGQEKILLVGHSWGSVIGILAARQRPDLFSAYVGMGQVAGMATGEWESYAWTLQEAVSAQDDRSVSELLAIGPPPWKGRGWRDRLLMERRILGKFGGEVRGSRIGAFDMVLQHVLVSREYTLRDRVNWFRGILRSVELLYPQVNTLDLQAMVPDVEVPVYFLLGRHDHEVPWDVSARYFNALGAPRKRLELFESSAHMMHVEETDRFVEYMVGTVLRELREDARIPVPS